MFSQQTAFPLEMEHQQVVKSQTLPKHDFAVRRL